MSPQQFILLNVFLMLLLGIYFLRSRRSQRSQTRLRMSGQAHLGAAGRESFADSDIKSLNVIFVYNGHSFDAHEVLGVPAGSSISEIKKAYHVAKENADTKSHDFLEAAWSAIERGSSSSSSR